MPESFTGAAVTLDWSAERVALATMTRAAAMNTLTLELLDELGMALDIAVRDGARALIVTGSGRAFCCGAHLDYFTDPDSPIGRTGLDVRDNYLAKIAALFDRFEAMAFPVIAAINGWALGGGCEMAISADFRLMAAGAKIGVPEVRLGAIPGAGGVQKLARHVGRGTAIDWTLTGRHVTAEEAERRGLLTAISPTESLLADALALAERLAALSPRAIAQAKAAIYTGEDLDRASSTRFGLEALALLVGSPDWQEGMQAFQDKREPDFSAPHTTSPLEGEVGPQGRVGGLAPPSRRHREGGETPHPSMLRIADLPLKGGGA